MSGLGFIASPGFAKIVLQTSLGKTYAVGGSSPSTFSFNLTGPVYGFYGENIGYAGGTLSALGIWTDASLVPPSPPPPRVRPFLIVNPCFGPALAVTTSVKVLIPFAAVQRLDYNIVIHLHKNNP